MGLPDVHLDEAGSSARRPLTRDRRGTLPSMSAVYALNLFDLAPNDDYKAYSKRSVAAVGKHGGRVVALGRLSEDSPSSGGTPRQVMVLVEWPSAEAFRAFKDDPDHTDLHPLREGGTENYLWWAYDRLEDLRPVLNDRWENDR
jgi:uncharacterized protein (DUF1330 family)